MTTNLTGDVNVSATETDQDQEPGRRTSVTAPKDGRTVPASSLSTFRAFWPITDETVPPSDLIRDAARDLPMLTARAHAVLVGDGSWSIKPSCKVPGSGRVTETVLLYEAAAVEGRSPFDDAETEGAA